MKHPGIKTVPSDSATDTRVPRPPQGASRAKKKHGHLNDVGFTSLVAYFFCVLASVSVRSSEQDMGVPNDDILVSFLAFVGAACLALLFLALAEPYMLRHDNHKRLSRVSGLLLACGPACFAIVGVADASNSLLVFLLFSLSGCGYALCLLVWGRVLSAKEVGSSSRQILRDVCAAVIVMVVASAMPLSVIIAAMTCLGLVAGFVGSVKAVAADAGKEGNAQVVVSDTRSAIPRTSYFVSGTLWLVYGVFWALLSGVHVFGGHMSIAAVVTIAVAAVAAIAIVGLHRHPDINLSKASWVSLPLLVTGLIFYVVGEQVLSLAVVLIALSLVISYLHLMAHFATLAHRPDLLSDQMFAWGWLAPFVGMFAGVLVGMMCRLLGDSVTNIVLPLMGGILVVTLLVSMRSVEGIVARRREHEAGKQEDAEAEVAAEPRDYLDEVLSGMGLSMREKEVALLLLQGRSQAVIADQLFVAASTVNTHVKHIYRKADVCSKQEFIDVCQERLQELSGSAVEGGSFHDA